MTTTPDGTREEGDAPVGAAADPLCALLRVLELEPVGTDVFTGASVPQMSGRVFGGQVLAQSLLAAGRTLDVERLPHSMHGYFLRPGGLDTPIEFSVERLRDGRSFSARRTHAIQGGAPILSMIASFQEAQPGFDYAEPMPHVPRPDEVISAVDTLSALDHPIAQLWVEQSAFDLRHVNGSLYLRPAELTEGRQAVWVRSRGPVPDDQLLHRALLAYACDLVMLEPILRAGGHAWTTPGLSIASLDHSMWWHRDVHVDEWLLFTQSSPSAQGGRGLGAARVFAADGTLVATIAQEGMVRVPD